MKLLFHIHTNHSFDCAIKPQYIIDFAIKNNIDIVAITDHDTMNGSLEAANYAHLKCPDLKVIIGAEYNSNCGDIIGLFLKKEIKENDAEKLIDEIHIQGGLAVLPHPLKGHKLNEKILEKIDVIETFNARCSNKQNLEADGLAAKYNKPSISGNDAHLKKELKLCYNIVHNSTLLQAILDNKEMFQEYTSKLNIISSQIVKGYKTKDLILILKMFKSLLSIFIFQPLRNLLKMNGNNKYNLMQ